MSEDQQHKEHGNEEISNLERLASLHKAGAITDEEFQIEKRKVLHLDKSGATAPTEAPIVDFNKALSPLNNPHLLGANSPKRKPVYTRWWFWFWVIAFVVIVAVRSQEGDEVSGARTQTPSTRTPSEEQRTPTAEAPSPETRKIPGIGETLKTSYFDVTVHRVSTSSKISTGNEFADLKYSPGSQYLIINVTFKNTDNESRVITDGEVLVSYNGKDYEFDKSETIMLDGWGLIFDQINPLTSKTTNLVFKLPTEITGPMYYHPGRTSADDKIFLGNLVQPTIGSTPPVELKKENADAP